MGVAHFYFVIKQSKAKMFSEHSPKNEKRE